MKVFSKQRKRTDFGVGSVLVAKPFWDSESLFARAVILIVGCDSRETIGIIVNKLGNMPVRKAVNELELPLPLFYGGDIAKNLIVYLHNLDIPESMNLGNGLYVGGDYDYLKDAVHSQTIDLKRIKFCAGSIRWETSDLRSAINRNKWWIAEMNAEEYFRTNPEDLWGDLLILDGHPYGLLANEPDPSLN